ncbi:MAG TPA: hypothetical protein VK993_04165, partial [Chthoniobacterales bacterium]|nr:hypothetical protein [Chthoniobacterales bacterium]
MKRSIAALLWLAIVVVLVANSAQFFFHQPYHEWWDSAADSLSIIRAKQFAQLYGSYSQWQFHHPGPAFFYLHALGEWILFDLLGIAPAPFNAQVLIHVCFMTGILVAALRVFTHWLPVRCRYWFLPLCLGLAVVHFTSASAIPSFFDVLLGPHAVFSKWTPHALALLLLCLLTAAASVAAGRGEELPLMVIAGGFLVHAHVAQPLFVAPVALAAYGGLLANCNRRLHGVEPSRAMWPRRLAQWLSAAVRACPRTHLIALGLLALFVLPLVLDLVRGSDSNFSAVLRHLREHHGERKTFARSLLYFLQFGAYAPYEPRAWHFAGYDRAGVANYFANHAAIYAAWAFTALVALTPLAQSIWTPGHRDRDTHRFGDRRRSQAGAAQYLAWCGAFLTLALGLTVLWGCIQDGRMFYYNGWFNFGIYYFAGILAAAVIAQRLTLPTRWRMAAEVSRTFAALPSAALVIVC